MNRNRYQVLLEAEQYEPLRRLAFERRLPIATMVRAALAAWLKREMGKPAKPREEG